LESTLIENPSVTPAESTLSKVYENKRFYPPLESALSEKGGGGSAPFA
jgi:hypothetical protein